MEERVIDKMGNASVELGKYLVHKESVTPIEKQFVEGMVAVVNTGNANVSEEEFISLIYKLGTLIALKQTPALEEIRFISALYLFTMRMKEGTV